MKKDLEFLLTGTYKGLAIGDSIEKFRKTIQDPFHNMSDGDTEIYSDDNQAEFIFINNELYFINLKSFKQGFLPSKFKKTIRRLNKKKIEWYFNQELTLLKQLTIRMKSSGVDLIFDLEHQNEGILKKVILSRQCD